MWFGMNVSPYTIEQLIDMCKVFGLFFQPSFGPQGLDKLIYDDFNNHLLITNDGAAILQDLDELLEPRYTKIIIKWGKTLAAETGDGIKLFYILLGEILAASDNLKKEGICNAHIIDGIRILAQLWDEFRAQPDFQLPNKVISPEFLRIYLNSVISGKLSPANTTYLVELTVQIIKKLGNLIFSVGFDFTKSCEFLLVPGGTLQESRLLNGIAVNKEPSFGPMIPVEGIIPARILFITQKLYFDPPKDGDRQNRLSLEINLQNPEDRNKFHSELQNQIRNWADAILKVHPDIVVTEKGVDDHLEQILITNHIALVRRVKPEQFHLLCRYFNIDPIERVEEITFQSVVTLSRVTFEKVGRDHVLLFEADTSVGNSSNCVGTVLIGGATWYICQEIERFIKKILKTGIELNQSCRYYYGGGNVELQFAEMIKNRANAYDKSVAHVLSSFADCYITIPRLLISNGGQDPIEGITRLRNLYYQGQKDIGFNATTREITSMTGAKIFDNYYCKNRIYKTLFEISEEMTRIDKVLTYKKKIHPE
jgi:chaperonin GroEL (HSP60 family)